MSKKNISFIIVTILTTITMWFIFKSPNKKKAIIKTIIHPQIIEISDLNVIKNKINKKQDFLLYIGHGFCSHYFYNNILVNILEKKPNLKINFVDFIKKDNLKGQWNKIIGPKNKPDNTKVVPSPIIPNFTFYFTPTLVFVKDGIAKYVWDDFSNGPRSETRYFRNDPAQKEKGLKNARNDVLTIINKWINPVVKTH